MHHVTLTHANRVTYIHGKKEDELTPSDLHTLTRKSILKKCFVYSEKDQQGQWERGGPYVSTASRKEEK